MTSNINHNAPGIVVDLHQRGFTNDFHSWGNDLFWVQGQSVIGTSFTIMELHVITEPRNDMAEVLIFGITATQHNIKGIIILRPENYMRTSPLLLEKLGKYTERHSTPLYN